MRTLLASNNPDAKFAVDLFVHRIVLEIGKLAAALEGLDCLIFTAGVGENSAIIREMISEKLLWLDNDTPRSRATRYLSKKV